LKKTPVEVCCDTKFLKELIKKYPAPSGKRSVAVTACKSL